LRVVFDRTGAESHCCAVHALELDERTVGV
jgi:hypothetical protein